MRVNYAAVKYAKYIRLLIGLLLLAKIPSEVDWQRIGPDLA